MIPEAKNKRLPVFKTIRDSFLFPWEKKNRFLRAHSVHILVFSILFAIFLYFVNFKESIEESDYTLIVSFSIVALIAGFGFYILFVITCHRLVLMDESAVPKNGMIAWTKREWGFLIWLIAFVLFYGAIILIGMVYVVSMTGMIGGILDEVFGVEGGFFVGPLLGLSILPTVFYMTARVSPIFPATAIDKKVNMTWAWNLSEGNGWRLALVLGVAPLILELISLALEYISEIPYLPYVELILYFPTVYFLTVVEIVALSLSYKNLVAFNMPVLKESE